MSTPVNNNRRRASTLSGSPAHKKQRRSNDPSVAQPSQVASRLGGLHFPSPAPSPGGNPATSRNKGNLQPPVPRGGRKIPATPSNRHILPATGTKGRKKPPLTPGATPGRGRGIAQGVTGVSQSATQQPPPVSTPVIPIAYWGLQKKVPKNPGSKWGLNLPPRDKDGTVIDRIYAWYADSYIDTDVRAPVLYEGDGKRDWSLFDPPSQLRWDVRRKMNSKDQEAWLLTEPEWKNRIGYGNDNWIGKKVLGAGTYGVAGLWELEDTPYNRNRPVRQVVVKQSGPKSSGPAYLKLEAKYVRLLGRTGSQHTVRLYKDEAFLEKGIGAHKGFDPLGGEIGRIFLEYCPGGDLTHFLNNTYDTTTVENPVSEKICWLVFRCMGKGLSVLESGSEPPKPSSFNRNIVHFDIKPDNMLIGSVDTTGEHTELGAVKFADFGLMDEPAWQDTSNHYRKRGSPYYLAPEQTWTAEEYKNEPGVKIEKFYTRAINVWQVGKMMFELICRGRNFGRSDKHNSEKIWASFQPGEAPILTLGGELLDAPYSIALRRLTLSCLAINYKKRPGGRMIVQQCEMALKAIADAEKLVQKS